MDRYTCLQIFSGQWEHENVRKLPFELEKKPQRRPIHLALPKICKYTLFSLFSTKMLTVFYLIFYLSSMLRSKRTNKIMKSKLFELGHLMMSSFKTLSNEKEKNVYIKPYQSPITCAQVNRHEVSSQKLLATMTFSLLWLLLLL